VEFAAASALIRLKQTPPPPARGKASSSKTRAVK
jgi:hypothetical protein